MVLCGSQGTHTQALLGYLTGLPRTQFVSHGPWDFMEQINTLHFKQMKYFLILSYVTLHSLN